VTEKRKTNNDYATEFKRDAEIYLRAKLRLAMKGLTQKQLDLFNRIYPTGVEKITLNRLPIAYGQVMRTKDDNERGPA